MIESEKIVAGKAASELLAMLKKVREPCHASNRKTQVRLLDKAGGLIFVWPVLTDCTIAPQFVRAVLAY